MTDKTNEMIERVAKAIGDAIHGYVNPIDTPNTWASSVFAAEEAIKAMREPTAAMLVYLEVYSDMVMPSGSENTSGDRRKEMLESWQAAIDRALA